MSKRSRVVRNGGKPARMRVHGKHPRDFVPTPLATVKHLIPHLRAEGTTTFCEPCAGEGDLVRHLESFGLRCVYQGDVATGQDALDIQRFDAPVISNLPFSRESKPLMFKLMAHFLRTAPLTWLVFPADFVQHVKMAPYLKHCTTIVRADRACWYKGDKGTDYVCWFRFDPRHTAGPKFASGPPDAARLCSVCGKPLRGRADKRACSDACRQRSRRARLAVSAWP